MKKWIMAKAFMLSLHLCNATTYPVNPYAAHFQHVYTDIPDIPRGLLEAVAFTNTRFEHLLVTQDSSCAGLPKSYGVMGLMLDGAGFFNNNLAFISEQSGISKEQIIKFPSANIKAYALALQQVSLHSSETGWKKWLNAIAVLSELPTHTQLEDYPIRVFQYGVVQFLTDSLAATQYGFQQAQIDGPAYFGEDNWLVLSGHWVQVHSNYISAPSGLIFDFSPESIDYGPAFWTPAASCNYSNRNGILPSAVGIHTIQGSYAGCISWFQNCNASVSAHYVIRSFDGQITQMVNEQKKAWHLGTENAYTIGIEHEGYVSNASWYTQAMYQASALLVRDICASHNIPTNRISWWPWAASTHYNQNATPGSCPRIKGHQHYPNQTHVDPGIHWDWNRYYKLINPNPTQQLFTNGSGSLTDPGGGGNYGNDQRMVYTIQPLYGQLVRLQFTQFDLEPNWDYVYVYSGNSINGTLLGAYTGSQNPGILYGQGAITLEFRSDCSSTRPGFKANWTSTMSTASADNQPPISQVHTPGAWKTQSFWSNFNDFDPQNGSGIRDAFYLVTDYDGIAWRGNTQEGFLTETFDTAYPDSAWHFTGNSWQQQAGYLKHLAGSTEELAYQYVEQNSNDKTLYHWEGKILGAGTQRKCTFYFKAQPTSNGTIGNGYALIFRPDAYYADVYKIQNSTRHLMVSFPLAILETQDNDFKIVWDDIHTTISLYLNHQWQGSWSDPGTIPTGNTVAFSGVDANWELDEVHVFKGRTANQPVYIPLGIQTTDWIRQQSRSPFQPAGRIWTLVNDSAMNWSLLNFTDIKVDWTAPNPITWLHDITNIDSDSLMQGIASMFYWDYTDDIHSGITRYQFALGTTPGDSSILQWHDVFGNSFIYPAPLAPGMYYASLKVVNGAGLSSTVVYSDGFLVYANSVAVPTENNILISCYPNPTNQYVYFNIPEGTTVEGITVADMSGRILLKKETLTQGEVINLRTCTLQQGIYMVILETSVGRHAWKILFTP